MQPYSSNNEGESSPAERNFWQTLGILLRWRRWIVGATLGVAVAAVVISLLLPDWYRASTRLLPPASSSSNSITKFLSDSDIAPMASSLLGGGASSDYMRFMSLLTSHTVMGTVVDKFDLIEVYETTDTDAPRLRAIETLGDNVEFAIDNEYEYLSIQLYDKDPQRAAEMANYFAEVLNDRQSELATENATRYRKFVEDRYRQTEQRLDSARVRKQEFEEDHGVIELPEQAKQFLTSMAELRVSTIQNEIRLGALQQQYGSNNAQVASLDQMVQTAHEKQEQLMSGQDALLPVAYQNLPEVSRQYAQIMQEVTIQEELLKFIRPLYEQAIFDERQEVTAVQVIDPATPPVDDSWPPRAIICVMATLSAFLLSIIAVLTYDWFRRHRQYLADQIRSESRESAPPVQHPQTPNSA
jgi:uncharacterized protein involved in exopolysaccharide biosynthesis